MSKKIESIEVLQPFLESTRQFHLREIARKISISPETAKKYLTQFTKKELLVCTRERGNLLYEGNASNEEFRFEKRIWNIRRIRESGLLTELNNKLAEPTIILFGSWARGENHEESDVDIFIRTEETTEPNLKKYEKKLGEIQLLLYNRKKFELLRKHNKELLNNIINGVILYGYVDIWEERYTAHRTTKKQKPSRKQQKSK